MDLSDPNKDPVLLTDGIYRLATVAAVDGVSYWTKVNNPKGVAVATTYGTDSDSDSKEPEVYEWKIVKIDMFEDPSAIVLVQ